MRVAYSRDEGVTIEKVAADFGVLPIMLPKWMRQAAVDEGCTAGCTTSESAQLRELRRRNRLLEHENEVLRRAAAYLSQSNLPGKDSPARERAGRRRDCRGGDVSGARACPPADSRARMKPRLATQALASGADRRGEVVGCIPHSDRGSQCHLDRTHLAPPTPGRTRPVDPDRVRDRHDHLSRSGRVTETVTFECRRSLPSSPCLVGLNAAIRQSRR
jgi:transposase